MEIRDDVAASGYIFIDVFLFSIKFSVDFFFLRTLLSVIFFMLSLNSLNDVVTFHSLPSSTEFKTWKKETEV